MDDESLRQILCFFHLSWQGYRRVRKGVKKRLARHMLECGCRTTSSYLHLVQEDPEARRRALELLAVSISRFFRDRRLWEVLGQSILPTVFLESDPTHRRPVRAWSAGCSCGEEVYSLKILWEGLGAHVPGLQSLEVWATDSNPEVLEKARAGVYPPSSLRNLPPALLGDCFAPAPGGFALKGEFKKGIHWLRHDFITQPPPGAAFDLIFLRNNLLTYYEPAIHVPAFLQILRSLRSGGILIVGRNEQIPATEVSIQSRPECRCIFQKSPALP